MGIRSLACRGAWGLRGLIFLTLWAMTSVIHAAQLNLAWDPSPSTAAAGYTVHWGTQAGNYKGHADAGKTTRYTVAGLENGKTYYFAVTAYDADRERESATSNEVEKVMAPIAEFRASPTGGEAPLPVSFENMTAGTFSKLTWDFGDGATSQATANVSGSAGVDGLVAAFGFEEQGDATVDDASGQGNDGVVSGAASVSGGKFGRALSFDGVNDWVTVADSNSLDLTSGMTLEAWVYPTAPSGWRQVILKETATGLAYALYAHNDASGPAGYVNTGGEDLAAKASSTLPPNKWTHLAVTYDGTSLRLYENGIAVGSLPVTGSVISSAGALRIGGNKVWGELFSGRIDEVRIYNRAISEQEIRADMQAPVSQDSSSGGSQSNERNPKHTYTTPGTYTVTLTATGPGGSDTVTKNNLVVVAGQGSEPPVSNFTISPKSGLAPLDVNFTDTSSGDVNSWRWSFGDGGVSDLQSPSHTYSAPGTYPVSLTVKGSAGSNTKTVSGAVTVLAGAPEASFTSRDTAGKAPLVATFRDTSRGDISAREWNFGDGTRGTGDIAVHTYEKPGTYSVSLKVTGPGGSDTITKSGHVVVDAAPMEADFSSDVTEGDAPLKVSFTDLSNGDIDSWSWDFGDGETGTSQYPDHTYQQPGTYTVTLKARGPAGSDSITKSDYITVAGAADEFFAAESVKVSKDWTRVNFSRSYEDPVVIAKPMNSAHSAPAVVRIRNIDKTGFEIRLQPWGNQVEPLEPLSGSYLVMERGTHTLPNGKRVEAGRLEAKSDSQFGVVGFKAPFAKPPVVVSSITSMRGIAPVVVRQKTIRRGSFRVRVQEQESGDQLHPSETVDFVAWERSRGTIGGTRFEVAHTRREVTHQFYPIDFASEFGNEPEFLADMQLQGGRDPANLRYRWKNTTGVKVRVAEETSRDSEVTHARERVGYILIEKISK